jgi:hypothetical protein
MTHSTETPYEYEAVVDWMGVVLPIETKHMLESAISMLLAAAHQKGGSADFPPTVRITQADGVVHFHMTKLKSKAELEKLP